MPEQALEGIRILDLTQSITGPFATKLLASYGADVIKIEKPKEGDPARRLGPFYHDEVNIEKSGLFLYLNMGKRGITLNLESPTGVKIFKELVRKTDIVLESFQPGFMASLGLDYGTLERINPRLVMTSISSFGQTGPYRDYKASEIILFGMGGEMYCSGASDHEPVKMGETFTSHQLGFTAAVGTMGAFLGSVFQGVGQHVDMSMIEALTAGGPNFKNTGLIAYQFCGEEQPRLSSQQMGYPFGIYPCQNGYFAILCGKAYWERGVKMLGEPDFLNDPKWTAPAAQSDPLLREEFEAFFIGWSMQHTKQECMEIAQENGVPCTSVQDASEVIIDPHLNERGAFVELSHPMVGRLKYPGRPFIMSETPFQIIRPAPILGEHNHEVYKELNYSNEDITRLAEWDII